MMMALSLLLLRLVLGLIFLSHGAQKLFGVFGGHGFAATTQFMHQLGLHPANWWTIIGALGELVGGLLLVLGLLTPLGSWLIIGVMLIALARVHWRKGFWSSQGGYEYNLVLSAVAVVLGLLGAGVYSLDAVSGLDFPEPQTFLFGLLALLILLAGAMALIPWLEQRPRGTRDWRTRLHHPFHV
ncbi:MAG TPA: DoxX family protein [Ktedonobacteraceae bacterium]|nr:DoxX family protein [Ktedonobacteraceae bacterium]